MVPFLLSLRLVVSALQRTLALSCAALCSACGGDNGAATPPAELVSNSRPADGGSDSEAPGVAPAQGAQSTGAADAAAPGPDAYRVLRKVAVIDEQGFGQPIEALSLLIPSDWSFEGGVAWVQDLGCPANGIRLSLHAASPDGRTGAEVFPSYVWGWSDDASMVQLMQQQPRSMRCDLAPPVPALEWLQESFLPHARQGARVLSSERLPEVARALDREVAEQLRAAGGGASGVEIQNDVARLRIRRSGAGGALEEWLTGTVQHQITSLPSSASMMGYGGPQTTRSSTSLAFNLYALWAPEGELDRNERLFASIVASARPNPVWLAAVQRHLLAMSSIAHKGTMDRSRILAEANEYVSNLRRESWEASQRSQDKMAEAFSQTIRGVETYVDTVRGGEIELPGGYQDVWTNGNGEYVLSEVAGWDPNTTLSTSSWTQIHGRK